MGGEEIDWAMTRAANLGLKLGEKLDKVAEQFRMIEMETEARCKARISELEAQLAGARAAALKEAADRVLHAIADCSVKNGGDKVSRLWMMDTIKAAQSAILSLATTPPGYVVVPVEPTEAMLFAGADASTEYNGYSSHEVKMAGQLYRVMIANTGGKE